MGTEEPIHDAAGRLISTTLPNGVATTRQYDDAGRQVCLTHTAADDTVLSDYQYQLDGVGNHLQVIETLTGTTRVISNTYDPLNRLIESEYSTSEQFEYVYDAVGNRTLVTSTTPLSGTVVTTYTYDAANRLTNRVRSDGRAYTYDWSNRGQMLTEWTEGLPVRTFDYDSAGRLAQARVLTLTTRFTYDGDGARRVVEVVGHGTTTYTLDYGRGNRILAEETVTGTLLYLYGRDCLGQYEGAEDEWLYYLNDATGYMRQGADEQGEVMSSWLFDPDGTMLEGLQGLVSHLICGGVYDWSTGLIFKGGGYFDPNLGIWLALLPLVMIQSWRGRKRKRRRGMPWYVVAIFVCVGVGGMLTGCGGDGGEDWTDVGDSVCIEIPDNFESPPPPEDRTSHPVKIVNHSGPKVEVTKQRYDSYLYQFDWTVNFEVDRTPGTGGAGWIIQQIDYYTPQELRSGPQTPDEDTYWEAWPVDAGSTEPTLDPESDGYKGGWDDYFWLWPSGSNGWSETKGIVKFYEGELPTHFKKGKDGVFMAGPYIYSSHIRPIFWDFSGTCHSWALEWNGLKKLDNEPFWSYEARAGNLETSGSWSGSW